MGLEAVKDEIIANAKEQKEALIAEAKKEAQRIMKEAESRVAEFKEKAETEAKKLIEMMKRQETASAELESKKLILEAKKEAVESVFNEARKRVEKLSGKQKEEHMNRLLEKAKKDIEVTKVYCSKNDAKLVKGFKAEHSDIIGGLIAENADGTVRVDYSFDTLLQDIKENELQKISRLLFG